MDTKDILIYESGDGGEFSIQSGDLTINETLYNQVYLALFGGNIEADTKREYLPTEERNDYWGNALIFSNEPEKQFNSTTERTINNTALNSAGRLAIIRAVEADLQYLSDLLTFTVDAEILSVNTIRIIIKFEPLGSQQSRVLQLVYNNAKNELITELTI